MRASQTNEGLTTMNTTITIFPQTVTLPPSFASPYLTHTNNFNTFPVCQVSCEPSLLYFVQVIPLHTHNLWNRRERGGRGGKWINLDSYV